MKRKTKPADGKGVGSIGRVSLKEVQDCPALLLSQGVTTLAWLTHEAEYEEDDLTFIAIQNIMDGRPYLEQKIFNDEYRRIWPEHAKARGYHKQANARVNPPAEAAQSDDVAGRS